MRSCSGVMAAALGLAFFAGGCQGRDASVATAGADGWSFAGLGQADVHFTRLSFEEYECRLVPLEDVGELRVRLGYASSDFGGEGLSPDELSRLPTLLALYLGHAALEYARSGSLPTGVHLVGVDGDRAKIGDPGQRWWFAEAHGAEYCQETLAVRQGGNVVTVLDVPQPDDCTWVPFVPESYDTWWASVDAALGVARLFVASD